MNAIVLITIAVSSIIIILAIVTKKRNSRNNKKNPNDTYNNFHLGEMTSHDIPATFIKREKEYAKWSSRQIKKADTNSIQKKGEERNGKESSKQIES
jgi:hypothetical protein